MCWALLSVNVQYSKYFVVCNFLLRIKVYLYGVHIYEQWVAYEKFKLEPRGRGHVIDIVVHFYLL